MWLFSSAGEICTVAILAQGTHWAVAVTQAFLYGARFPLHPPISASCPEMMALPWHAEHADGPYVATVRPEASVMTHLQHDLECFQIFLGCLPCFFYNHDLWSWIVAKLHHSIASVIIHLLHNFKFSTFLGQQVQLQPPEVIVIFGSSFQPEKIAP